MHIKKVEDIIDFQILDKLHMCVHISSILYNNDELLK